MWSNPVANIPANVNRMEFFIFVIPSFSFDRRNERRPTVLGGLRLFAPYAIYFYCRKSAVWDTL